MQHSEIAAILASYARLINSPRLDYYQLLEYMKKVADKKGDAKLQRLVKNHIPDFVQVLNDLEREGKLTVLRSGGMVSAVEVGSYYGSALKGIYQAMGEDPTIPFPDKDALKMELPPEGQVVVDVKQELTSLLAREGKVEQELVRLNFPEGINHLYVPAGVVGKRLVELAVAKVGQYAQDQRNLGYLNSKLRSVLAGSEVALGNLMNDLVSRPGKAVQSLTEPNDFALKFWTHFASLVLQDLTKKKDKSREDHAYCQSSYIIGYYVVYQRGVLQREKERTQDTKRLEVLLKRPPYAFSLEQILSLRDSKGVAFTRKHSREFVIDFLKERTRETEPGKLSPIVRVRGPERKEYFIPRELIAPLFVNKVHEAAEDLRKQYVDMAVELIRNGSDLGPLAMDESFIVDLRSRIQESYHLLHALLNGDLLFLAREECPPEGTVAEDLLACFAAPRRLRPLEQVMKLDRKKLIRDARALLPLWYTIPIIRSLFMLLRRLFTGKKKGRGEVKEGGDWVEELRGEPRRGETTALLGAGRPRAGRSAGARSATSQTAAFRKHVHGLVKEFAGSEGQMSRSLAELAEKWNPLFDEAAKRNLVEDVNSYVRDFVRSLRKGFRVKPPDAARIRGLAEEFCGKQALSEIRKKDYLRQYVEIYMIQLLLKS